MSNIEVTVAISCYNFAKYIEQCVQSIIKQKTTFSFEVIIVDDHSTDNSVDIIHKLLAQNASKTDIRLIEQAVNLGSDATKQLACKLANGRYIAFLDGDDVAYPGKLQYQYDYLIQNPDCSCCYHDVDLIDCNDNKLNRTYFQTFYNHAYIPQKQTYLILCDMVLF